MVLRRRLCHPISRRNLPSSAGDPQERLLTGAGKCGDGRLTRGRNRLHCTPRSPSSFYLSTRRVDYQAQRGVVVQLENRMHEGKCAVRVVQHLPPGAGRPHIMRAPPAREFAALAAEARDKLGEGWIARPEIMRARNCVTMRRAIAAHSAPKSGRAAGSADRLCRLCHLVDAGCRCPAQLGTLVDGRQFGTMRRQLRRCVAIGGCWRMADFAIARVPSWRLSRVGSCREATSALGICILKPRCTRGAMRGLIPSPSDYTSQPGGGGRLVAPGAMRSSPSLSSGPYPTG